MSLREKINPKDGLYYSNKVLTRENLEKLMWDAMEGMTEKPGFFVATSQLKEWFAEGGKEKIIEISKYYTPIVSSEGMDFLKSIGL